MKRALVVALLLVAAALAAHAAPSTDIAGVRWHASMAAARSAAAVSHKPILDLEMLGRLDEELC